MIPSRRVGANFRERNAGIGYSATDCIFSNALRQKTQQDSRIVSLVHTAAMTSGAEHPRVLVAAMYFD
jgi:hypothetical protein